MSRITEPIFPDRLERIMRKRNFKDKVRYLWGCLLCGLTRRHRYSNIRRWFSDPDSNDARWITSAITQLTGSPIACERCGRPRAWDDE